MGADPLKEAEPTAEQITAFEYKVVALGNAPYANFSVLNKGKRLHSAAFEALCPGPALKLTELQKTAGGNKP